ncbi:MAG: hypothetical protein ACREVL_15000 [Solimonas sp.]
MPDSSTLSPDQNLRRLMLAVKDYIEAVEVSRQQSADPAWTLDEAITRRDMPELYYEVLDELATTGTPLHASGANDAQMARAG